MLPPGSRKAAKWQTPESHVWAMNSTPFASSSALAAETSATRIPNPASYGVNGRPSISGYQKLRVTFGVSTSPSETWLSGSPRTSRYHAIARAMSRVGIAMKSTCPTRTPGDGSTGVPLVEPASPEARLARAGELLTGPCTPRREMPGTREHGFR